MWPAHRVLRGLGRHEAVVLELDTRLIAARLEGQPEPGGAGWHGVVAPSPQAISMRCGRSIRTKWHAALLASPFDDAGPAERLAVEAEAVTISALAKQMRFARLRGTKPGLPSSWMVESA